MAKGPFATITEKGLNGVFRLEYESQQPMFVDMLTRFATSNQRRETYAGLGTQPKAIEWAGEQHYSELADTELKVENKKWSDGIIIPEDLWYDDKTGQVAERTRALASELRDLQSQIVIDEFVNNTTLGYDGQPLFSASHRSIPGQGSNQTNLHDGTAAGVTADGFRTNFYAAMTKIIQFVDDRGRPMNRNMRQFIAIVNPAHIQSVEAALGDPLVTNGGTNTLARQTRFSVTAFAEPLVASSQYMYVFGVDKPAQKPIIIQEKTPVDTHVHGPGSEFWDEKRAAKFGAFWSGGTAPLFWQSAVRVQLT